MANVPILFLIFNRPDTTARVFEAIRAARPERLYIAADGPRAGREAEIELCAETRRITAAVDWPCEVTTLFREEHMGCGRAVSSAISWFFNSEPEGVILEDDCLPGVDYFPYCSELLAKYRHEEKVMFIGSTNFQGSIKRGDASYYFSSYSHVWGWASWRRAWEKNDFEQRNITRGEFEAIVKERFLTKAEQVYWHFIFRQMLKHKIDTWDYQWQFSIWRSGGITVIPNCNLVSNIGYSGTHSGDEGDMHMNMPTSAILPIVHNKGLIVDREADLWFYEHHIMPAKKQFLHKILSKPRHLFS